MSGFGTVQYGGFEKYRADPDAVLLTIFKKGYSSTFCAFFPNHNSINFFVHVVFNIKDLFLAKYTLIEKSGSMFNKN